MRILSPLPFNIDSRSHFYEEVQETATEDDVTLLLEIEENAYIQDDSGKGDLFELTQNNCDKDESEFHFQNGLETVYFIR